MPVSRRPQEKGPGDETQRPESGTRTFRIEQKGEAPEPPPLLDESSRDMQHYFAGFSNVLSSTPALKMHFSSVNVIDCPMALCS